MTRAIADLFFTYYNGNIMGVARVYWKYTPSGLSNISLGATRLWIYCKTPQEYTYSPIHPCHAHYIITRYAQTYESATAARSLSWFFPDLLDRAFPLSHPLLPYTYVLTLLSLGSITNFFALKSCESKK